MELLVLNENFEAVALVDTFESLIWTDRYNKNGDFEIYQPMDISLLNTFKADYYLWNAASEHSMIIENIIIDTEIEQGNHLTVSGRSLEVILERRVLLTKKTLSGNFQNAVHTLLNENIINPSNPDRKIDNFIFEESVDENVTLLEIEAQLTLGTDLYTAISGLCTTCGIGFKIVINDDNQFVFSLYAGADRSYDQIKNPYVIFSPDFDNIINTNYLESKTSYKNVTLVAGEEKDESRMTTMVGTGSGLNRREMFTDANDVSSTTEDDVQLTTEQYRELLIQRGNEDLAVNTYITAFEGEVEATKMYVYGKDFFIGDIVQIANEYGHEKKVYISEFIMSQDQQGISMYPTFENLQEGEDE